MISTLNNPISIVMTATIIPNAAFTSHRDAILRRDEYLSAIKYYSQFGRVYFLENSEYELDKDQAFFLNNVEIRKFPPSLSYMKGKGYQEFEMLDEWLMSENTPPSRWIKVTGRYIFQNFGNILNECNKEEDYSLIIDQFSKTRLAVTSLFYITTDCYKKHFKGIYKMCDDESGDWVEKIIFKALYNSQDSKFRIFKIEPKLHAISGSMGKLISTNKSKGKLKDWARRVNLVLNNKYILR